MSDLGFDDNRRGVEEQPPHTPGAAPAKLIVGISLVGTAAAMLSSELGIPRWVTLGLLGGYGLIVVGLLVLSVCTTDPARQWIVYRLLRVLLRWLPELAEAVKPRPRRRRGARSR